MARRRLAHAQGADKKSKVAENFDDPVREIRALIQIIPARLGTRLRNPGLWSAGALVLSLILGSQTVRDIGDGDRRRLTKKPNGKGICGRGWDAATRNPGRGETRAS